MQWTRESIENGPSRWRDCVLIFFFHIFSIMTVSCFWSKEKKCERSQSLSYSVEMVGGGEEQGQLGIGEGRKAPWKRGCLGLGMAPNSLGKQPRTWWWRSAALQPSFAYGHGVTASSWNLSCSLFAAVPASFLLGRGVEGSGGFHGAVPERMSRPAQATLPPWHPRLEAGMGFCGKCLRFAEATLETSVIFHCCKWLCFTLRWDGLGVKSRPRHEYSETTERDPPRGTWSGCFRAGPVMRVGCTLPLWAESLQCISGALDPIENFRHHSQRWEQAGSGRFTEKTSPLTERKASNHSSRKAISQVWKKFPLCHPLVTTSSLIISFWKLTVESSAEFREEDPSLAQFLVPCHHLCKGKF